MVLKIHINIHQKYNKTNIILNKTYEGDSRQSFFGEKYTCICFNFSNNNF